MLIYIITHSRSIPIKAYFNEKSAYEEHARLKEDKETVGNYGIFEMVIEDAPKQSSVEKVQGWSEAVEKSVKNPPCWWDPFCPVCGTNEP